MSADHITLAERYVLDAPIATGGMAEVWRARDEVLARTVAIKILLPHLARDPVVLERFKREALAAARLAHPSIVAIFDTGRQPGGPGEDERHYIVMEYCSAGTLAGVLRRGPLEPDRAREVGAVVCDALAYAHGAGVVHRDVKPANVLISEQGLLKVADFGIAKAAFATGDITTSGIVLGTVTYLSPEQLEGAEGDERSDVYSLGVLLYEALTGRPPFAGESHMATALMHLREPPPPPRSVVTGVPRDLEHVVLTALEKDPDRRFPSAAEMRRALDVAEGSEPTVRLLAARPDPQPDVDAEPTEAAVARRTVPVIGLIALAVVIVLALARVVGDDPGAPEIADPGRGGDSAALEVRAARDFDPHGDGWEHPERVPFAHDGDASTSWVTQSYHAPLQEQGKPGVGIEFDLGAGAEVTRVVVRGSGGYTFELRAADEQGSDERAFEMLERVVDAPETSEVDVDAVTARYWLVWITDLAGNGTGRAEISGVTFIGP